MGRSKPLLAIPEQISHLKSKGVTFEQCSEALFAAAIDVEHFAKQSVLRRAAAEGEDGYAIVADLNTTCHARERPTSRFGIERHRIPHVKPSGR